MVIRFLLLSAFFLYTPSLWAQNIAISFTLPQSGLFATFSNGISGFDFTPTTNLLVTDLGWYDQDANGLNHNHPMGMYHTATQALLATNTVTNASPLAGSNYRFEPITPLLLSAGITYTIAGYTNGPNFDPEVLNPVGGIIFGDGFVFNRLRQDLSNGLQFPSQSGEDGAIQSFYLGMNFCYSIVAVPEPSTYLLCGLVACIACPMIYLHRKQTTRCRR